MAARSLWPPPQTGDALLDRSFEDLSQKLSGIDAVLSSVAVPIVATTTRRFTITDETFVDCRGVGGFVVQLPSASSRGTGRGSTIFIQNNCTSAVAISTTGRESVNGLGSVSLAAGSLALCSGNGANVWLVIATAVSSSPGHVIEEEGTPLTQRPSLNFIGSAVTATDNPGSSRTDVTVSAGPVPDTSDIWLAGAWYPSGLQVDSGTALTTVSIGGNSDFVYAHPMFFKRAVTIVKLGCRHTFGREWQAIYSSNATDTAPVTRLVDFEQVSAGVNTHTETTINLSVAAGTMLWFASVMNGLRSGNGYTGFPGGAMRYHLGSRYAGAGVAFTGGSPGYRVSQTYGRPPSTWTGTTKSDTADSIPAVLFTVQP